MKKSVVLFLALPVLMAGCSSETKEEQVCVEMVRLVAADPQSVQVNSIGVVVAPLSPEQYAEQYSGYSGSEVGPALRDLISTYKQSGKVFSKEFVKADVSFQGKSGLARSTAICTFLNAHEIKSFVAFEIAGQSINQSQFIDFFTGKEPPENLSLTYQIE